MNVTGNLLLVCGALLSISYLGVMSKEAQAIESQFLNSSEVISKVNEAKPKFYKFIKDKPILVFEYKVDRFEDLPDVIAKNLTSEATMDQTSYAYDHLATNPGGAIALQMDGKSPDFYVIGPEVFRNNYKEVALEKFETKNPKSFSALSGVIDIASMSAEYSELKAVLKTTVVPMVKMSEIGISTQTEVTIESPWGEQTKPEGKDAYLVYNSKKEMYYMVNTEESGLPSNYVPASE